MAQCSCPFAITELIHWGGGGCPDLGGHGGVGEGQRFVSLQANGVRYVLPLPSPAFLCAHARVQKKHLLPSTQAWAGLLRGRTNHEPAEGWELGSP